MSNSNHSKEEAMDLPVEDIIEEAMDLPVEDIIDALGRQMLEILMLRRALAIRPGPTPVGPVVPHESLGFAIPVATVVLTPVATPNLP